MTQTDTSIRRLAASLCEFHDTFDEDCGYCTKAESALTTLAQQIREEGRVDYDRMLFIITEQREALARIREEDARIAETFSSEDDGYDDANAKDIAAAIRARQKP